MLICSDEIGLICIYLGSGIHVITSQSNDVTVSFAECKSVFKERHSS